MLQNHTFRQYFFPMCLLVVAVSSWNQDNIEAVPPCCFNEHNRNGSQHSVHLHCYLGICALLHLVFLFFTIVCDRNISLLHSEGSDVRIVAFRVDSGECFEHSSRTDGDLRVLSRIQAITPSDVFLKPWRIWSKMTISSLMFH